jgi:hypothetical protein
MAGLPLPGSRSDLTRKAVLHAISKTRTMSAEKLAGRKKTASLVIRVGDLEGRSFSRASLYKYGGSAFRKVRHGERTDRYLKPSDRIRRRGDVFSYQRGVEIDSVIHGSADASKVGAHYRAVLAYRDTGDPSKLLALSEDDRTLSDGRVLVGDPDEVQRAADEGQLDDFREAAGS